MSTSSQIAKTKPVTLRLEVATFDWRSPRIQFALGLALTLLTFALAMQEFFATRFLPQEYLRVGKLIADGVFNGSFETGFKIDPVLFTQLFLFNHHAWWYRTLSFVATGLSAMATGLIALEITIRYGDRIGASSAIFAALLYLSFPYFNALTLPATTLPSLLSSGLGLFAVFFDSRLRLLRESGYYWLTMLFLVMSGVFNVGGLVVSLIGIALARLFVIENEKRSAGPALERHIGLTSYFLVSMLFILPHLTMTQAQQGSQDSLLAMGASLCGLTSGSKIVSRILPILLLTVYGIAVTRMAIASLWLRPIVFSKIWLLGSLAAWWLLKLGAPNHEISTDGVFLAPAICIFLTFLALPAVDTLARKWRVIITLLGSLALSGIIVCWGLAVLSQVRTGYTAARELSLFKVALAKRMEKTAGKLVVVNPPLGFAGGGACDRDAEEKSLMALLNSPLTGQNVPVVGQKRLPTAFPRLIKAEENSSATNDPAARVTDFYVWSSENSHLLPIYYSGAGPLKLDVSAQNLKTEPPGTPRIAANQWMQINKEQPFIELSQESIGLYAGTKTDLTVWFGHESLDPTKAARVLLTCAAREFRDGNISASLVFKGKDNEEIGEIPLRKQAHPNNASQSITLQASTKGLADWNKHSGIATLGIKLPAGSPGLIVKSIETSKQ